VLGHAARLKQPGEAVVTASDWLTLLIAYKGAPDGLDPVRVQKAMFLFQEDESVLLPTMQQYDFVPYNYGPMSKGVYADLDMLVAEGLVARETVPGQTWTRFRATGTGLLKGQEIAEQAAAENHGAAVKLFEIKELVASKTFNELVQYVYDRHPEMEERSIFARRW
jgi:uncharacterized protein YwgA